MMVYFFPYTYALYTVYCIYLKYFGYLYCDYFIVIHIHSAKVLKHIENQRIIFT